MADSSPCLIAVMGCTGAGKSSFIRLVTGSDNVTVGHGLKSKTSKIECYQLQHRGGNINLVDTPGFDDSSGSDQEILMALLGWLKESYEDNYKLSGILYLHRIDAPRMQGSALRNFGTFKELCGEKFYKNIVLGTTCWDLVDAKTIGMEREEQLKGKGGFWHTFLQKGSEMVRIPRDREAAKGLVFQLASKDPAFLKSQDEMGRMGFTLDQVSAAKTINEELEKLKARNEQARREQQERFEKIQQQQEDRARDKLEQEQKHHEKLLREQEEDRLRLMRTQCEREAQREKEMKKLEEQMRQARVREAEEKEREREMAQKRLDNQQFSLDYKTLCRAMECQFIKISIVNWLKICGNCSRLLENEYYVECSKSCLVLTEPFRLCQACKPLDGVACPGGNDHWSGMEWGYTAVQESFAIIGTQSCLKCETNIGPLGFQCGKDSNWLCLSCLKSRKICCSGESMWMHKLTRS